MQPIVARRSWPLRGRLALLGMLGGLAACGSIEPVEPHAPITDAAALYSRLTLNHPAVTLSTASGYNTLQLVATPYNALGEPMTGLPAPTFRTVPNDTAKIRVTEDGLVTALGAATDFQVIAELVTAGPVRHADTALINITTLTEPPVLGSLDIDPMPPDSGMWAYPGSEGFINLLLGSIQLSSLKTISPPRVTDTAGMTMTQLQFEYMSLDPMIARVDRRSGVVTVVQPGPVQMVARTTAYGVVQADTATFTVTPKIAAQVEIGESDDGRPIFPTGELRIAPTAVVGFYNQTGDSVDIVFDDPTHVTDLSGSVSAICTHFLAITLFGPAACGAGDMSLGPSTDESVVGAYKIRQFPMPGEYPYRDPRSGATGRIRVSTTWD